MNKLKVVFPDLPYAVEEAMNRLRINVKFCGKNTKKILLTSCMPNEGKSTVSSYLWKMLAEAGFSTVMVDVDLRKSVQMQRMQVENASETKGLNHYLSGMAEYEDVVYKTNIENAYIVPCTQLLENPSPLLEDARFRELLDRLAGEYRFVIVDTPPLGSVSDGALIASMCDGAILVVRAGQTPKARHLPGAGFHCGRYHAFPGSASLAGRIHRTAFHHSGKQRRQPQTAAGCAEQS